MSFLGLLKINLLLTLFSLKGRLKSLFVKKPKNKEDYPVDFVVTWVDNNDTEWQKEKSVYEPKSAELKRESGAARYRDWNQFMYWFRAVEKYAPWVRKVYLVTYGHIPKWLNTSCKKLEIVKHSDFIPEEYLPTFSSIPIEMNVHRIKGLSEHFVYFCDDFYLSRPTKKEDFFQNGLPKYCALAIPIFNHCYNGSFQHHLFSNIGVINGKFDVRRAMMKNPELWFSKTYKNEIYVNKCAFKISYLSGMYCSHLGAPYRKSTIEEIWNEIPDVMDKTSRSRFREYSNLNHQIFSLWEIMKGNFVPVGKNYYGVKFGALSREYKEAEKAFKSKENLMVCLNDSVDVNDDNFQITKERIDKFLLELFPQKSDFEL